MKIKITRTERWNNKQIRFAYACCGGAFIGASVAFNSITILEIICLVVGINLIMVSYKK